MRRACPQHGEFNVYLWPEVDSYQRFATFGFPPIPPEPQTESANGCPRDCGLCPRHRRHTTLAEIEVTWHCNLDCPVCFMASDRTPPDPTLKTIAGMFQAIRQFNGQNTSIQLTGGEPTIRADLPEIVAQGRLAGFTAIEVNTNGLVIAHDRDYLQALKDVGVTGVYLQFDGVTPEVTQMLRGADLLSHKFRAIDNCRAEGVPVVLAATIVKGINEGQLGDLITFAMNNQDVVCGLALQPVFKSGRFNIRDRGRLSLGDVANLVEQQTLGRIDARDFWSLGCSHPFCSCATYLLGDTNNYVPFTRYVGENDYRKLFNDRSPQGSIFNDILTKMGHTDGSAKGLSVLIMSYMDVWTMDLTRARECSMTVTTPDGRSVPFCIYHLSSANGQRLYPFRHERSSINDGV